MTREKFIDFTKDHIIYLDGATGSNLVKAGMPSGVCPEQWILSMKKEYDDKLAKVDDESTELISQARQKAKERGSLHTPVVQLPGDGGQGQEIVVLRPRLVLLERLTAAAYHIEPPAVLQHILLGVGFMLVFHQSGGKGAVGGFHGRVAVVHADGDGIFYRVSPPFSGFSR